MKVSTNLPVRILHLLITLQIHQINWFLIFMLWNRKTWLILLKTKYFNCHLLRCSNKNWQNFISIQSKSYKIGKYQHCVILTLQSIMSLKLKVKFLSLLIEFHKLLKETFSKSHDNSKVSKELKNKIHQEAKYKVVKMSFLWIKKWAEALLKRIKNHRLYKISLTKDL